MRAFVTLLALSSWSVQSPAASQVPEEASRTLYFQLPIDPQDALFLDNRDAALAGRLSLRILGNGLDDTIVVFDRGHVTPGWLPVQGRGPNELAVAFQSTTRYRTGPSDSVIVELFLTRDIRALGPTESGTLREGIHRATGSYAQLRGYWSDQWLETIATLEEIPLDSLRAMPEARALVARLNAQTGRGELSAAIGCWRERWTLTDRGPGFMPPEQAAERRAQQQRSEAQLVELNARMAETRARAGRDAVWVGSTCAPPAPPSGVQRPEAAPNRPSPPNLAMREVAAREEVFFSVNRRYTADVAALGLTSGSAVSIRIVFAGASSWGAVATMNGVSDGGCAMWYGAALEAPLRTPGGRPAGPSGTIVCDP